MCIKKLIHKSPGAIMNSLDFFSRIDTLSNTINSYCLFDVKEIRLECSGNEVIEVLMRFVDTKSGQMFVLYVNTFDMDCQLYIEDDGEESETEATLTFTDSFTGRGVLVDWLKHYED
jgi:hypothetical protein